MPNSVFKKIEVVGTSPESYAKATANAVEKAGESIHGMCWFEVTEMRGAIQDGKVSEYQVTVRIGFKID